MPAEPVLCRFPYPMADLPKDFARRALQYGPTGQERSQQAWSLMTHVLKEQGLPPEAFCLAEAAGKPVLKNSSLQISLAHCKSGAAVLVCEQPCGVDIEEADRTFSLALRKKMQNRLQQAGLLSGRQGDEGLQAGGLISSRRLLFLLCRLEAGCKAFGLSLFEGAAFETLGQILPLTQAKEEDGFVIGWCVIPNGKCAEQSDI